MAIWTVGSGQTYATPQLALDALYTAVGTTPFTETQTIEIYSGTYAATTISPNFVTDEAYHLIVTAATSNTVTLNGLTLDTAVVLYYLDVTNIIFTSLFNLNVDSSEGVRSLVNVHDNIFSSCNLSYFSRGICDIYNNTFTSGNITGIDFGYGVSIHNNNFTSGGVSLDYASGGGSINSNTFSSGSIVIVSGGIMGAGITVSNNSFYLEAECRWVASQKDLILIIFIIIIKIFNIYF